MYQLAGYEQYPGCLGVAAAVLMEGVSPSQALELSNFSLAQHLKQATDARTIDAGRHVF